MAHQLQSLRKRFYALQLNDSLRYLRMRRGMTQNKLADTVGLSSRTIRAYETGERQPDIVRLMLLLEHLALDDFEAEHVFNAWEGLQVRTSYTLFDA